MIKKIEEVLNDNLLSLKESNRLKGKERVITGILPHEKDHGVRIETGKGKSFINFASNGYLGVSKNPKLIDAEHKASLKYGVGPGAVRFISGTYKPHIDLENRIARFFEKESAMIFNSAYSANCGLIFPLISEDTVVVSDELNHNSIIMAIKMSGVKREKKIIYRHCDMSELKKCIESSIGKAKRLIVATDGVFSMRGDIAPLSDIVDLSKEYNTYFDEGIITIVDDSHGVGAFGDTGRGTVEICNAHDIDIITGTLGKALGVDGGFVVSGKKIIEYLRETSPFYIYSNPISCGVASAAHKAIDLLDSSEGLEILKRLKENTEHFRKGIERIGFKTIEGIHPIIPILIGDSKAAKKTVSDLYKKGIWVIALTYPVVPKGQDTIRVQVSASHTKEDIEFALKSFAEIRG